jgi:hypothetical protein
VTKRIPDATAASTTGSPASPSFATSKALRRMPTSTMPRRNTVVTQNFRPGWSAAGSVRRFRSRRPRTIATGTPEIGLLPLVSPCAASSARPTTSASQKPTIITTSAAAIPGMSASRDDIVTRSARSRRRERRIASTRKARLGTR